MKTYNVTYCLTLTVDAIDEEGAVAAFRREIDAMNVDELRASLSTEVMWIDEEEAAR